MQERPTTKPGSIRFTEQDEQFIGKIISSGRARNRSAAVSYALRVAAEELEQRERSETVA